MFQTHAMIKKKKIKKSEEGGGGLTILGTTMLSWH